MGSFGICVALGRHDATVHLASEDDIANRFAISGRLAVEVKESSYPGLIKQLAEEEHKPGSYTSKFKDAKRQQLVQAKRSEVPAASERKAQPAIRDRSR